MKLNKTKIANFGQWAASFFLLGGILVEVSYRAHAGFILITLGSAMFALFTKIKYHKRKG